MKPKKHKRAALMIPVCVLVLLLLAPFLLCKLGVPLQIGPDYARLTQLELVEGHGDQLLVERDITMNCSNSPFGATDTYTLTNSGTEAVRLTLAYPFISTDQGGTCPITAADENAAVQLYAGKTLSWQSASLIPTQYQYRRAIRSGSGLTQALQGEGLTPEEFEALYTEPQTPSEIPDRMLWYGVIELEIPAGESREISASVNAEPNLCVIGGTAMGLEAQSTTFHIDWLSLSMSHWQLDETNLDFGSPDADGNYFAALPKELDFISVTFSSIYEN